MQDPHAFKTMLIFCSSGLFSATHLQSFQSEETNKKTKWKDSQLAHAMKLYRRSGPGAWFGAQSEINSGPLSLECLPPSVLAPPSESLW